MIRLRRARVDDAADLARTWLDQAATYAELDDAAFEVPDDEGLGGWLVEQLRAQADPDRRLVLVADVEGGAVGFVVAALVPPHPAPQRQMQRDLAAPRVQIEALAVRGDHLRRGVGTRLVTAVEDWARNRGATAVTAQAFVAGPAGEFLSARGYAARAVLYGKALRTAPP